MELIKYYNESIAPSMDIYEVADYVSGNEGQVINGKVGSLVSETVGTGLAILMLARDKDGTPYLSLATVHSHNHGIHYQTITCTSK